MIPLCIFIVSHLLTCLSLNLFLNTFLHYQLCIYQSICVFYLSFNFSLLLTCSKPLCLSSSVMMSCFIQFILCTLSRLALKNANASSNYCLYTCTSIHNLFNSLLSKNLTRLIAKPDAPIYSSHSILPSIFEAPPLHSNFSGHPSHIYNLPAFS